MQKPSFLGMQSKVKATPLVAPGKPSLADLMNQYEENEYTNISLKLNSETPKIQVHKEPKLLSHHNVEEDWPNKRTMSPLRLARNKENINDQGGHRKKSINEVNRFADCVRELEKHKPEQLYPQDQEILAFQPRHMGNKSPLRGRIQNPVVPATSQTSSLLRHAEGDMVFRAKDMDSNVNFTQLSKRFNGQSNQQAKTPRSRSKIGPKIQKQFQESDESELDSEAASLKQSIRDHKQKLFKFHENLRPDQKEELERKMHQIKQENLKVLAEKKTMAGNKVLPKVIEDMKANVAREIEEFARNYLVESQDQQEMIPKTTSNPTKIFHADDPRQKKIMQQTRSQIKDYIEIKKKKGSSMEEEDLRHVAQPASHPKWNTNQQQIDTQKLEEQRNQIVRQRLIEQERLLKIEMKLAKQMEEERERKRALEEERILAIRREEAQRIEEQRLQAERVRVRIEQEQRFLREQGEEQRRNEQYRMETERLLQQQLMEQQRMIQIRLEEERRLEHERQEAEKQRQRMAELERLKREKEHQEKLRLEALEQQRLMRIRLEEDRRQEEERRELQRLRWMQVEEEVRIRHMEEQRRLQLERQRQLEEQRIMDQRMRQEQASRRHEEQMRRREKELQEAIERQRLERELRERERLDKEERLKEQRRLKQQSEKEEMRLEELRKEEERIREQERVRLQQEQQIRRKLQDDQVMMEQQQRQEEQKRLREQRQFEQKKRLQQQQLRLIQEQRVENEKREQLRLRMLQEQRCLKAQMELQSQKAEQQRIQVKVAQVTSPIVSPIPPTSLNHSLRNSMKVDSLFTNFSIFNRQERVQPTPQDKITKLFDKVKNDKTVGEMEFKFDFGLDLDLGDGGSVLSSRDKIGRKK